MAYQPVPEGIYEVSADGGTSWARAFNVNSFSISGGDREETTTDTLDEGSIVAVGDPRPKDISLGLNANPGTKGYQILRDGYKDSKKVQVRVTTNHKEIFDNAVAGNTLAIAANTGALTATAGVKLQTSGNFRVGRAIVIANTIYVIESITSETAGVVYRADGQAIAAVNATQAWDIVEFGVRLSFEAEVLSAMNWDLSPGSPFADTFTLKGTGVIPDPTYIVA